MKITKLEIYILRAPEDNRPHWVSHFIVPKANEILVRMHTDTSSMTTRKASPHSRKKGRRSSWANSRRRTGGG